MISNAFNELKLIFELKNFDLNKFNHQQYTQVCHLIDILTAHID